MFGLQIRERGPLCNRDLEGKSVDYYRAGKEHRGGSLLPLADRRVDDSPSQPHRAVS